MTEQASCSLKLFLMNLFLHQRAVICFQYPDKLGCRFVLTGNQFYNCYTLDASLNVVSINMGTPLNLNIGEVVNGGNREGFHVANDVSQKNVFPVRLLPYTATNSDRSEVRKLSSRAISSVLPI